MDDDKDDKSIVEKTIAAVKDIATIASDAAKKAMEPEPLKPGEQIVAYMPMVNDGLLADPMMPPFVLAPRRKKSTSKKVPKKSAKKAAKTTKKTAKRATAKKTKSAAGRKAVRKKKAPKKVAKKKKAKKSKR